MPTPHFSICIPTYKRPHLLRLLVEDILKQSLVPDHIIVVDGDPKSGDVRRELSHFSADVPLIYVPSNHGNLPYQRYLGWRAAEKNKADIIIYFDDDQRIVQSDVIKWLAGPFSDDSKVVGVGCYSRVSRDEPRSEQTHPLVRWFGSRKSLDLRPGYLTPTGHRVALIDGGEEYVATTWLQGRVMAYRMASISESTFSDDLFATYEHRIGRAEDTFLSRQVGVNGNMLFTYRAIVDHPNADTPKAYSTNQKRFAYAATYSRRFLNDHYRIPEPPTLTDRWALVKSYAGTTLLAWMRTVTKPSKVHFALARGTTLGAIHGLTRPPTAKRLTPDIDWRADAEAALKNAQVIHDVPRPQ